MDLYLEESFIKKGTTQRVHGGYKVENHPPNQAEIIDIGSLRARWANCLQVEKNACRWPNVRFHYVDMRLREDSIMSISTVSKLEYLLKELRRQLTDLTQPELTMKPVFFALLSERNFITADDLIRDTKFSKQLSAIRYPELKIALLNYWEQHVKSKVVALQQLPISQLATILSPVNDIQKSEYDKVAPGWKKELESLWALVWDIQLGLMDSYTLARMLRCFPQTQGRYSEDPKYIVFYGGDGHRRLYAPFFSSLPGFRQVFYSDEKARRTTKCLDATGFSWQMAFPLTPPNPDRPPCPIS